MFIHPLLLYRIEQSLEESCPILGQSQEYAGILCAIGWNPKKADMKELFREFPAS